MKTRLKSKITAAGHPICIGFDPDTTQLTGFLKVQFDNLTLENFLARWYEAVLTACPNAHSIKFQSAFFEQAGAAGIAVLRDLMTDSSRRGIFTILDAKRGDISSTMSAYGSFAFEYLKADALTVLPWMGTDTLTALLPWIKAGKGVYVVWLSSNAAGRALQTTKTLDGGSIAAATFRLFYEKAGELGALSQIGWVLGATDLAQDVVAGVNASDQAYLCPGIGAQGGRFDLNARRLHSGNLSTLFPISRGLTNPGGSDTIESWTDYETMIRSRWQSFISDWNSSRP